ncbi:MAG: hypothetical protein ACLP4V_07430, partial [Methylocella sp.]
SAPAAARVLLSLIWGITTGCLSYAPKGKLPAGVCLIIIGTEGCLSQDLPQKVCNFCADHALTNQCFSPPLVSIPACVSAHPVQQRDGDRGLG